MQQWATFLGISQMLHQSNDPHAYYWRAATLENETVFEKAIEDTHGYTAPSYYYGSSSTLISIYLHTVNPRMTKLKDKKQEKRVDPPSRVFWQCLNINQ